MSRAPLFHLLEDFLSKKKSPFEIDICHIVKVFLFNIEEASKSSYSRIVDQAIYTTPSGNTAIKNRFYVIALCYVRYLNICLNSQMGTFFFQFKKVCFSART